MLSEWVLQELPNRLIPTLHMPDTSLKRLRSLRDRADRLLDHVSADLGKFVKTDNGSYFTTPSADSKAGEVSVSTTCSCLMCLALTGGFKGSSSPTADDLFLEVVNAPWTSSGLIENNAFTTSLVIRTLGFLACEGCFKSGPGISNPQITEEEMGFKQRGAIRGV